MNSEEVKALKQMRKTDKTKQANNKTNQVTTFSVPTVRKEIAENISISTKPSKEKIVTQALKLHELGKISEAAKLYQELIDQGFNDPKVLSNYGVILKQSGQVDNAIKLYQKSITLFPNSPEAYSNIGKTFLDIGKLNEAEIATKKAIKLKPDFADAYTNLGIILRDLGKLKEAEIATIKAINLRPNFADSYANLGIISKDIGKLQEAEIAIKKAIDLRPDVEKYYSLQGRILLEVNKLKDAELSLRRAIKINPNFGEAHSNLSICLYIMGKKILALNSIIKANELDPKDKNNKILLAIFKEKQNKKDINLNKMNKKNNLTNILDTNPLILSREVEPELINSLYKIKARNQEIFQGPTFGNAIGSDYDLFNINDSIIQLIRKDLISISRSAVKSNVLIIDSFFTIFKSGGGLVSHNHLIGLDKINELGIANKKFSLVYYLSIGDQNCDEPGILKLENPNLDILPTNGLIVIFPAERNHSVFYKGKEDRIIIGVNFYSI